MDTQTVEEIIPLEHQRQQYKELCQTAVIAGRSFLEQKRESVKESYLENLLIHFSNEHSEGVLKAGLGVVDIYEAHQEELKKVVPEQLHDPLFFDKMRLCVTVAAMFHDLVQENHIEDVSVDNKVVGKKRIRNVLSNEVQSAVIAEEFIEKVRGFHSALTEKEINAIKLAIVATTPAFGMMMMDENDALVKVFNKEFKPTDTEKNMPRIYQQKLRDIVNDPAVPLFAKLTASAVAWGDLSGVVSQDAEQFEKDGIKFAIEDKPHLEEIASGNKTLSDYDEAYITRDLQRYLFFQAFFAKSRHEDSYIDIAYLPDSIKKALMKNTRFADSQEKALERAVHSMHLSGEQLIEELIVPLLN